ncbi:acyl carrier protein [Streptomyces radicis]|uniref:Acyl carrier protein n=1 Tax=Streptomyces radicis TaxID=1750517 RepID=A0A3A9VT87_9ACTN|nr:phosphopantetheine-binding protein [Streptomyces radicis]RKN03762.1 acyl carrier protein [Streptomyces radicis]RKN13868.1 acyl carrier protein [Streptomyces radicis]
MTTEITAEISPPAADADAVLADLTGMLLTLLEEYGLDAAEIGRETTFHGDLELESIDLVTLSGALRERYGDRVNFADFIADLELDEIIELTIGQLVDHVVASLRATERS